MLVNHSDLDKNFSIEKFWTNSTINSKVKQNQKTDPNHKERQGK